MYFASCLWALFLKLQLYLYAEFFIYQNKPPRRFVRVKYITLFIFSSKLQKMDRVTLYTYQNNGLVLWIGEHSLCHQGRRLRGWKGGGGYYLLRIQIVNKSWPTWEKIQKCGKFYCENGPKPEESHLSVFFVFR